MTGVQTCALPIFQLAILYGKKQPQLAEGYFKNAIRLNPNHIHARYLLGLHYQETGQPEQALKRFEEVLGLDAQYVPALFATGYILMADNLDYPEAVKWFDKVLETDKNYAPAWLNRGYCYERMGERDKARSDYKMALQFDPRLVKARDGLNRIDGDR